MQYKLDVPTRFKIFLMTHSKALDISDVFKFFIGSIVFIYHSFPHYPSEYFQLPVLHFIKCLLNGNICLFSRTKVCRYKILQCSRLII